MVYDLSGKTLTTPSSLKLGGWLCTPRGVASYNIRVTKVDGDTVENPELVSRTSAGLRNDIYNAVGSLKGYSALCAQGAGMNPTNVDLSAYAGKTVDFEIVAITRFGSDIVTTKVINVTVPKAE